MSTAKGVSMQDAQNVKSVAGILFYYIDEFFVVEVAGLQLDIWLLGRRT